VVVGLHCHVVADIAFVVTTALVYSALALWDRRGRPFEVLFFPSSAHLDCVLLNRLTPPIYVTTTEYLHINADMHALLMEHWYPYTYDPMCCNRPLQ
jgi:hypothetical protein